MTDVSARLNFRVRPETEAKLRAAAEAVDLSLTDFVISAAAVRADEILATNTVVSEQFFKDLINALDAPWPSRGKLAEDAVMARKVVRQA